MAKRPDPDANAESQPTFEEALAELETIVHDLEEGQLGLGESLAQYERGVKLMRHCHGLLEGAERKVELLTGIDAQGDPITEPLLESAAEPLEKKAGRRSQRRGAAPRPPREGSVAPPEEPESMDAPPWEE